MEKKIKVGYYLFPSEKEQIDLLKHTIQTDGTEILQKIPKFDFDSLQYFLSSFFAHNKKEFQNDPYEFIKKIEDALLQQNKFIEDCTIRPKDNSIVFELQSVIVDKIYLPEFIKTIENKIHPIPDDLKNGFLHYILITNEFTFLMSKTILLNLMQELETIIANNQEDRICFFPSFGQMQIFSKSYKLDIEYACTIKPKHAEKFRNTLFQFLIDEEKKVLQFADDII